MSLEAIAAELEAAGVRHRIVTAAPTKRKPTSAEIIKRIREEAKKNPANVKKVLLKQRAKTTSRGNGALEPAEIAKVLGAGIGHALENTGIQATVSFAPAQLRAVRNSVKIKLTGKLVCYSISEQFDAEEDGTAPPKYKIALSYDLVTKKVKTAAGTSEVTSGDVEVTIGGFTETVQVSVVIDDDQFYGVLAQGKALAAVTKVINDALYDDDDIEADGSATATATEQVPGAESLKLLTQSLKEILDNYVEAALWSTTYSGEDPDIDEDEDSDRSFQDLGYDSFSKNAEAKSKRDIVAFLQHLKKDKAALAALATYADDFTHPGQFVANFGTDFWLSRNGHGAGFFDHNGCKPLQNAARSMGEVNLYADASGAVQVD